ncbi:ABC transporter permease subunit [Jiella sp. MQZ9-1]|uniref:ABC transporter permease subunit n=1 Tax=Jiella flava TaxID=2816857 RepID=A0A939JRA4_9HYPH|nr:ABC transporter permease subunit [Jiella flava]MBO0661713.1 ABC transporter permease subunit [Jiella flava]MCD2470355.1 ABC transporter permease subunit [Jiella flava]
MTVFSGYGIQLLHGAVVSVEVTIAALIVGTVLGIFLGAVKTYASRPFRYAVEAYTAIVRGVPDLIIIYLIYFGSTIALTKLAGEYVDVNGFMAGVFALAFIFGAYASDVIRGAIRQVPRGQTEAAMALGLSSKVCFIKIVMPQAWRLALPGFGNLSIILLKQTSLISVIGLEELLRASSVVSGATRQPFYVYSAAAVIYLILTGVATLGLRYARKRADRGFA